MLRCGIFATGQRDSNGSEKASGKSAIYWLLARRSDAEQNG
jgi:hypothetical protein